MEKEELQNLKDNVGDIMNAYIDVGGGAEADAGMPFEEMTATGVLLQYITWLEQEKTRLEEALEQSNS